MTVNTDRKLFGLYILLAIVIVSIISLSILTIFLYNFYGRREFFVNDSLQVTYADGNGGVNLELRIAPGPFGCMSHVTFTPFSTGDVEIVGITSFRSRIYRNGAFTTFNEMNFATQVSSWTSTTTVGIVQQNTNITAEGFVQVQFVVDSIIEEETFNFKSTIIAPLDITGSTYSQLLPLVWVEFIVLLTIVALIVQAFYIGKRIKALRIYNIEMKIKDTEFFEYLEEARNKQE